MTQLSSRTASNRIRHRIVEGPASLGQGRRARRWRLFERTFPDIRQMSVLDLGGTVSSWTSTTVRPRQVTIVNLATSQPGSPHWMSVVKGDACALPSDVRGQHFDLVFSNSVLEHVGGFSRRSEFAASVSAMGDRHWIQTPNRYFPIEPHWLFPGFQFLPARARAAIYQRWPLAHTPPSDRASALRVVLETELVGKTELGLLFPASSLVPEHIGPFVKSWIAVLGGEVNP